MTSETLPPFALAPARESTATVALRERYGVFVGGAWTSAAGDAETVTVDPATEEPLARVADAAPADVDRAVRAARRGYEKYWRKLRPAERAKYVYRLARALTERSQAFAALETLDSGKPVRETSTFDVPQSAATLFYHAGWADKLEFALRGNERPRPHGVAAAIVPWNFPLLHAARMIAPALACGNTVVLKPALETPLTALLLADVVAEADLPPGVLNVVTGAAPTERALVEHGDVDVLSFAGPTEAGKAIRRTTAGTGRRLLLELEGKSAILIFDDAPLDQAIEGIVRALYFNGGNLCSAGARVLVQETIAADAIARLTARLRTLRHGDPLDKNTDVGAVVSRAQRERIEEYVRAGLDEGAGLVQHAWTPPDRGFWCAASFFTGVQPSHRIAREPVLGPVGAVMTFRTPDEGIERANNSPYGLAAGVWTASGALAAYAAQRLSAGVVWCNTYAQFDPSAPYGGLRESGIGRTGGLTGLRAWLDV